MKRASKRPERRHIVREMRPEYRLDYQGARPNRFAAALPTGTVSVILDPDVAAVFDNAEAVNNLLRSVIAAMPAPKTSRRRSTRRKRSPSK